MNEGQPDKLCDKVSDAVQDACPKGDPKSKVTCKTATEDSMVLMADEITPKAKTDYETVVHSVDAHIGFD